MEQNINFESLKINLFDVIKESQIKLGYAKESIGFYYFLDALNSRLDTNLTVEEMELALKAFAEYVKEELGEISVTRKENRFCIRVPQEGVEYVHEHVPDSPFLKEFIQEVSHCHLNMDALLALFQRYSQHVVCENIDNGEFDYLIYFADGNPDDYRYCIKFEGDCATYHRFTRKDYEAFGF